LGQHTIGICSPAPQLPSSPAPQRKCLGLGCLKKLPIDARTNQIYCGKKCRGRSWARANRRQSTTITAADFAALQIVVLRLAVGLLDVAGYSLSCACPNRLQAGEVQFPQSSRRTKRFPSPDGRYRFRRSAFFLLAPFEPPRVPIRGEYRLRFHREDGTEIVTATKLFVSVEVAFPSVRFYDAERDYDTKGRWVKPRLKTPPNTPSAPSAAAGKLVTESPTPAPKCAPPPTNPVVPEQASARAHPGFPAAATDERWRCTKGPTRDPARQTVSTKAQSDITKADRNRSSRLKGGSFAGRSILQNV
jgi:hypothetical protein